MCYARIVAVLTIQLCLPLFPQTDAVAEGEVRQFVTDLVNAELKPSSSELNKFFAEEFVATNAQGAVLSKSAVIAALTSGRLKFKSYGLERIDVQIHRNIAIIRDTEKIESNTGAGRFRHLRVAVRRDGHWQLVATQMTRVADQ
ncbi:MAG TPA: nuclear transport factor 2 family protein [Bryobacteraceae bacterium]